MTQIIGRLPIENDIYSTPNQSEKMTQIKQILVPTDFSKEANIALDTAVSISKKIGAKLSLLHILDVPNAATIGTVTVEVVTPPES